MTPAASAPPPTTPEVLPVPLGYQSPLPPRRPGARLWAAATALAAGLVLLGIALYALLSLASALTAAGSRAYSRDVSVRCLGTDLDQLFRQMLPFVGRVVPRVARKAWARRYGWSLWISGHKDA